MAAAEALSAQTAAGVGHSAQYKASAERVSGSETAGFSDDKARFSERAKR